MSPQTNLFELSPRDAKVREACGGRKENEEVGVKNCNPITATVADDILARRLQMEEGSLRKN